MIFFFENYANLSYDVDVRKFKWIILLEELFQWRCRYLVFFFVFFFK